MLGISLVPDNAQTRDQEFNEGNCRLWRCLSLATLVHSPFASCLDRRKRVELLACLLISWRMAHEVFISHSSLDKPIADAVCAELERMKVRCWIAPRDVQPGRSFAGEITRAIQQSKAMVLIFSAHSNQSEQVLREVQLAANSHLHIIQFRIQNVLPNEDLEYYLSAPHWLDAMTPPLQKNLQRLGDSVKTLLQMSGENLARGASPDSEATKSESESITPTSTLSKVANWGYFSWLAGVFATLQAIASRLWKTNRQMVLIGSGLVLLFLCGIPVALVISHRSISSSAEKEYDEAFKLGGGLNQVKMDIPKSVELLHRAAEKNFPEAEARLAFWTSSGNESLVKDDVKAEQWAKRALGHGLVNKAARSPAAQTELATLYAVGLGVTKDDTKAAELLEKAADQGFARAENFLGLLYQKGQGVPKNPGKAADLFRKAANQGYADAQDHLGVAYANGDGVPKDLGKAVLYCKKAADQDHTSAINRLGWMYEHGQGVTRDIGKAAELYQKAADRGHSAAQTNMGLFRQYGMGVPKDLTKAAEYYQRAANQENPVAENNLGWLYQNGLGVGKDYGRAADLFQKAINHGNVTARNSLGWMYQNGQGVPKDLAKAAELYQSAANAGNVDAETNLGFLYYNGQGITKDVAKAAELLQKAADAGNVSAQNQLAVMYYKGEGVSRDWAKAATLLARAADQGSVSAQMKLGSLYQNGQGVTKDPTKAADLYLKAADKGNTDAEVSLASLYENGEGVAKDVSKATDLYRKAAAQHNQTAIASLKRLSKPAPSPTPIASLTPKPPPTGPPQPTK